MKISGRLPHFSTHAVELNDVAGRIIMDGMLAYGWTRDAISKTDTRLRKALDIHCPDVLHSVTYGVTPPNITYSKNGGSNRLEESSLNDTSGFWSTPAPVGFDFEAFRDIDVNGDCDLYLSQVSLDFSL